MRSLLSSHAGPAVPCAERGAILLVVMILAVTFSVLSMALLSTAEISLRIQGNGQDIERAERAAQSGVEWAAAMVKAGGLVNATRSTTLDSGVVVKAQVRSATAPQLIGSADSYGVARSVGANAVVTPAPLPYAYASMALTNSLSRTLTIDGSAYLGQPFGPLSAFGTVPLQMIGDLDLVTSVPQSTSLVVHQRGVDRYSVTPISTPVWDTSAFASMGGGSVTVTSYSGTTTIKNTTLTGIVVVALAPGETLTLWNCTLNGTLVVPCAYPAPVDLFWFPEVVVKGTTTITGGTTATGNLAILAPRCKLKSMPPISNCLVSGVTYVLSCEELEAITLRGLVITRWATSAMAGPYRIERPTAFVPDVPVGITWSGAPTVRIQWAGAR